MIYDFMSEARTDKCRTFRKWLTGEVLPSIRANGMYIELTATTTEFEGQGIEIIIIIKMIIVDGEPQFELYSTGSALGYTRTRMSKGKEYTQIMNDRIDKFMKNGSITGLYHGGQTYLTEDMLMTLC